jgi:hypothetical protein
MVYASPGREYRVGRLVLRGSAWLWAEPGSAEEKGELRWEWEAVPRIGEVEARVDLQ